MSNGKQSPLPKWHRVGSSLVGMGWGEREVLCLFIAEGTEGMKVDQTSFIKPFYKDIDSFMRAELSFLEYFPVGPNFQHCYIDD